MRPKAGDGFLESRRRLSGKHAAFRRLLIFLKMVIKDVRYFENVGSAGPDLRLRVFALLLFQWLERAL